DLGKYVLAYLQGDEFPKAEQLEDPSKTEITAEILQTAISKTIFAAGNDALRPVMPGVYFQFAPSGVIFVATDAHKLVNYSRTDVLSSAEAHFSMSNKPVNIPENLHATSGAVDTIDYTDPNSLSLLDNHYEIRGLNDGTYPNC